MGYSVPHIEQGLHDLFAGFTLTTLRKGDIEVPVYVDSPDPEEYEQRDYPSLAIELESYHLDRTRLEGTQEEQVVVAQDDPDEPTTITTERQDKPWVLLFSIHVNTLDASADRDLVARVLTLIERRSLSFIDEDEESDCVEMFWVSTGRADRTEDDIRVYHKIIRFNVLARMFDPASRTTTNTVQEIHYTTNLVKYEYRRGTGGKLHLQPVDGDGNAVDADEAERIPHRAVAFNDETFWFPSL